MGDSVILNGLQKLLPVIVWTHRAFLEDAHLQTFDFPILLKVPYALSQELNKGILLNGSLFSVAY